MEKLTRTLLAAGSVMLILLLWPTVASRRMVLKADSGCANKSLRGAYATAINGFITFQTPPQQVGAFYPVAVSGTLTFDGQGNVARNFLFSGGGQVSPVSDSGTYQVNSDCTASANFQATGETFNFVVVDRKTATLINSTSGASGAGTMIKQQNDD